MREMGKETVFVITHIPTHTHKYFEPFQGALMKLSR